MVTYFVTHIKYTLYCHFEKSPTSSWVCYDVYLVEHVTLGGHVYCLKGSEGNMITASSLRLVLTFYLISFTLAQQQQDGRCDVTRDIITYTNCVLCSINAFVPCPRGTIKTSTGQGLNDCRSFIFQGCRHSCLSTVVMEERCCDGYWGTNCDRKYYIQINSTSLW